MFVIRVDMSESWWIGDIFCKITVDHRKSEPLRWSTVTLVYESDTKHRLSWFNHAWRGWGINIEQKSLLSHSLWEIK
jgi:hypothetical protein